MRSLSTDFGRVVSKAPGIVVHPLSTTDVRAALATAAERGITVTVRAAGHSQGGQSTRAGGVVLDMTQLSGGLRLDAAEGWLEVEAGATWQTVVTQLRGTGRLPPVLTDNLNATVAGTISTGGLGGSSFRHGPQAGLCLGLEVVTASGDVLWCDPDEHADVFEYVKAGLGQFAVITKVRFPLVPVRPRFVVQELSYATAGDLVDALSRLARLPHVEQLAGRAMVSRKGGSWTYRLLVVTARGLGADAVARTAVEEGRRVTPREFALRFDDLFRQWKRATDRGTLAHPWVEAFVPLDRAAPCLRRLVELVPPALAQRGQILVWPVRRCELPMLALPEGEMNVLIGVLPSVAAAALPTALDTCRVVDSVFGDHGAKRYLSGWVPYDLPAWRRHFGPSWPAINRVKRMLDPAAILGSDVLTFESELVPA